MCGVLAFFSYGRNGPLVDQRELESVTKTMALRGPDGGGVWVSSNRKIGLGHRRLSILDLSNNAQQPMTIAARHGKEGNYHITYNGEIYNFRALRSDLESEGVIFSTQSDTEVILRLYERFGPSMLKKLRGMYAFVIWDECNQELFLARDPYGIKPLYYYDDGHCIRVASQVKSLLHFQGLDTTPSPEGHVGFFLFGNIPEPHTLYKMIKAVPAGHWMRLNKDGLFSEKQYFDISKSLLDAGESVHRSYDLRELICDSLDHHFVSDVPVGLFLSGGVDSATLAALASESRGPDLKTITLGFFEHKGSKIDEVPLACKVSNQYSTQHHTEYITRVDFNESLEKIFTRMDQPTIDGINTYFVSKVARSQGLKVAISGLGGDELFGGYNTFNQIPKLVNIVRKVPFENILGKMFKVISQPIFQFCLSPKWSGVLELGGSIGGAYLLRRGLFMPWEIEKIIEPDLAREGLLKLRPIQMLEESCSKINESKRKIAVLEALFYMRNQLLRDSDWAGMAHSLEIRLPLVDKVLFESLAPVLMRNEGPTKFTVARTPLKPLPEEILKREKSGFFVPINNWMSGKSGKTQGGLRDWAKRVYQALNTVSKY